MSPSKKEGGASRAASPEPSQSISAGAALLRPRTSTCSAAAGTNARKQTRTARRLPQRPTTVTADFTCEPFALANPRAATQSPGSHPVGPLWPSSSVSGTRDDELRAAGDDGGDDEPRGYSHDRKPARLDFYVLGLYAPMELLSSDGRDAKRGGKRTGTHKPRIICTSWFGFRRGCRNPCKELSSLQGAGTPRARKPSSNCPHPTKRTSRDRPLLQIQVLLAFKRETHGSLLAAMA